MKIIRGGAYKPRSSPYDFQGLKEKCLHRNIYIALEGNKNGILCERGIITFETKTRNTIDIASIPIIKKETQLPILADLSHSLGRKDIVISIAKAVLSAGADGIILEVHPSPELALSDSEQQLNLEEFSELLDIIGK